LRFEQLVDLTVWIIRPMPVKQVGVLPRLASAVGQQQFRLRLRFLLRMSRSLCCLALRRLAERNWFEREAFDLSASCSGHPDLRRILTDYGFVDILPQGFPDSGYVEMRYDQELGRVFISRSPSSRVRTRRVSFVTIIMGMSAMAEIRNYTINFGPQHPAAHGVLRWFLSWMAKSSSGRSAYRPPSSWHRKARRDRTWVQSVPYMDRLDYVSMMCNEHAYCMAIERLLGLEVPLRAQYIRVLYDEITRVLNHLLAVGTHALDIGAMTMVLYTFREREDGRIRGRFRRTYACRLLSSGWCLS
jgi:hypothetical protein